MYDKVYLFSLEMELLLSFITYIHEHIYMRDNVWEKGTEYMGSRQISLITIWDYY